MVERISRRDGTFFQSYAEHIQRYEFALEWCRDKRVLDAGCGTGYGSYFLRKNGAASVCGIDISEVAIAEASHYYKLHDLTFEKANVEDLAGYFRQNSFDVIVNFENIEHIQRPERLVNDAASICNTFITSTPNGENTAFTADGKIANPFHVKEFKLDELNDLLSKRFKQIKFYGQYLTPTGQLRRIRAKELFDQLCEAYYNPAARLGRAIKKVVGKRSLPPPVYNGSGDMFPGDYVVREMDFESPSVIIAVCNN